MEAVSEVLEPMVDGSGSSTDASVKGSVTSEGLTQLHADTVQVVHDLAPTAALAFATANGGDDAFANNIRALAAAGAKVIVDDVGYFRRAVLAGWAGGGRRQRRHRGRRHPLRLGRERERDRRRPQHLILGDA
jgi:hypothetical protein